MQWLNEMVAFARVVDCGGFSQAARMHGVEPSSMSRAVARLERALQAKLLVRGSRAIALTEVGALVYEQCARIVGAAGDVRALADQYSAAPAGMLRMTAPVAFGQVWLAPLLPGFIRRFPEVDLRIAFNDTPQDLVQAQADVALRIAVAPPAALAARRLFDTPYVLVASPAYIAAHGQPDHPAQLVEHRCLHLGYGAFTASWTLRRDAEQVAVAIAPRYALSNSLVIATACEGGSGIGLIPAFSAAAGLARGALLRVLPAWEPDGAYRRAAYLVFAAAPYVAPKVRALVDYLAAAEPCA